jgi:carbamoyl-phosphate synthase large subunit
VLKEYGCEAIIVNNNPETVSTDFDTGDRLYFDPLTPESVEHILATEKPWACVVQFGGQTAIKLTKHLEKLGVKILGTSADAIDEAEDRERFDALLERCGIPRPQGHTVYTAEQALQAAEQLGYPVLLRPSYVLGGQNMIIAYNEDDVKEYMAIITTHVDMENPVLVDKYLMGTECEVDAICDGEDFLIPGMMEHIERAGIHSGDSISVYPPQNLKQKIKATIVDYTGRLARELRVVGLMNIQFVVYNNEVFIIEVNPRSSRTVPYISKVTGVPMVDLAVRCMLGEKLSTMGYGTGLYPTGDYCAVKVPVFSFEKLHNVDTQLGPEMKSTGEVLGIAHNFEDALLKGLVGAGYSLRRPEPGKCVILTVKDADKQELEDIAWQFKDLGYKLYATSGTAYHLGRAMVASNEVRKISEAHPNIMDLLESGRVDYVVSTSSKGRIPSHDSVKLRRKTVELSIPCLTSIDTARVLVKCLRAARSLHDVELVDLAKLFL